MSSTIPPSIPDNMTSGPIQGPRGAATPPEGPKKECEAEGIIDGIQDLETTPEVMERLYTISEVGTTILQTGSDIIAESGIKGKAAVAAGAGTAIAGVFFAVKGAKDLKEAIAKKDGLAGFRAAGELGLAGNAAISSAQMLTTLDSTSKFINPSVAGMINSPVAGVIGKTLGMVFAASELYSGGKLIHEGISHKNKEKIILGALSLGVGASAAALFMVGGVTSAVVLGALSIAELVAFGAEKVSDNLRKRHHDREMKLKAAAAEEVLQQPPSVDAGKEGESLLHDGNLTSGHHTP